MQVDSEVGSAGSGVYGADGARVVCMYTAWLHTRIEGGKKYQYKLLCQAKAK